MEYKIVSSASLSDLENQVNALMRDGWVPLGGLSISVSESIDYCYETFAQAMTKAVRCDPTGTG